MGHAEPRLGQSPIDMDKQDFYFSYPVHPVYPCLNILPHQKEMKKADKIKVGCLRPWLEAEKP